MNHKWIILFVLTWAYFLWHRQPTPSRVPQGIQLTSLSAAGETDPCLGKDRCVIVYMAPWCSACRHELPQFKEVAGKWQGSTTRGLKIVVGMGKEDDKKAMAQEIGKIAYIDEHDNFARKMQVQHFPTVWITDAQAKVLHVDEAAFNWLNQDLQQTYK